MKRITSITINALAIISFLCVGISGNSLSAPNPAPQQDSPAEQDFFQMVEREDVGKAREVYEEARKQDPNVVLFSEAAMNRLGYKFVKLTCFPNLGA